LEVTENLVVPLSEELVDINQPPEHD